MLEKIETHKIMGVPMSSLNNKNVLSFTGGEETSDLRGGLVLPKPGQFTCY
jgi:hypothetical protein